MNKLWTIPFAITLLAGSIAGCSGMNDAANTENHTANENAGEVKPNVNSEQVTLRFSWWGGADRHEATLDVIDLYMKKHPNVTIEGEYSGYTGYYQKLLTQLSSNIAPDIIQIDQPWIAELTSHSDVFVDLHGRVDLSGFDQTFLDDFSVVNGKLQALPTGLNGDITIYNKDAMSKAGIQVDEKLDWDKLIAYGEKLKLAKPSAYLLNSGLYNLSDILRKYMVQHTGQRWIMQDYTLGFTKKDAVDAFNFLLRMEKSHVLQPFEDILPYDEEPSHNPKWANGQLMAYLDQVSELENYQSQTKNALDVVQSPILAGTTDTGVVMRPSQLIAVNAASRQQETALDFLNFFYHDPEAIKLLGTVRGVPATADARTLLVKEKLMNPLVAKGIEITKATKGSKENYVETSYEVYNITTHIIKKVGFKKETPEQAADELMQRLTEQLAEIKKAD
ncbi:ABC transporter substrate-binding protein [Paenibacillus sp. OV219]|uniref:ABC transporter substrate-binding protein n=1 Tax=Paenibacillus sp. OV219 TaxID=1884377 RepID=UPI0008B113B1|nr:ABC transporter substrate-binding protein [Paenibacillus sp. OV219]SEN81176.1 oligogalacturonide transport system substrate-binding protein [Paenibacillus sp. OV219]